MCEKIITYPGIRENFYKIKMNGEIYNIKNGNIMKAYTDGKGYKRVQLQSSNCTGKRIDVALHRLICWEFNGPSDETHPIVNHKDGIKVNNHPSNLEWCSYSENVKHAIDNGLLKINRKYIYDIENIILTCNLILVGLTNMQILCIIYGDIDIYSEEQCNFLTTIASIKAGKSYQGIFDDCKDDFNINDYHYINIDEINKKIMNSRFDTKNIKRTINECKEIGMNKSDILDYITGTRISNTTIFSKRVYKLIMDEFK